MPWPWWPPRPGEQVQQAKALIKVEYEVLPGIFDAREGSEEGAPRWSTRAAAAISWPMSIWSRQRRRGAGQVGPHVVTGPTTRPHRARLCREIRNAPWPWWDDENQEALIYSSDQGTYDYPASVLSLMGWKPGADPVINALVGGGFRRQGGRERTAPRPAAGLPDHRPVKVQADPG